MTTIEKIRKEVERRIKIHYKEGIRVNIDRIDEDEIILAFLDTLEAEQPSLPVKGLEDVATEFANQDCVTFISRKKGFIAGAKWMAGRGVNRAASDLVDAVERYTKQKCLRSELLLKNNKLKELLNGNSITNS